MDLAAASPGLCPRLPSCLRTGLPVGASAALMTTPPCSPARRITPALGSGIAPAFLMLESNPIAKAHQAGLWSTVGYPITNQVGGSATAGVALPCRHAWQVQLRRQLAP